LEMLPPKEAGAGAFRYMQEKIVIKGAREHPAPNRVLALSAPRRSVKTGNSIGDGAGNLKI